MGNTHIAPYRPKPPISLGLASLSHFHPVTLYLSALMMIVHTHKYLFPSLYTPSSACSDECLDTLTVKCKLAFTIYLRALAVSKS